MHNGSSRLVFGAFGTDKHSVDWRVSSSTHFLVRQSRCYSSKYDKEVSSHFARNYSYTFGNSSHFSYQITRARLCNSHRLTILCFTNSISAYCEHRANSSHASPQHTLGEVKRGQRFNIHCETQNLRMRHTFTCLKFRKKGSSDINLPVS